MPTWPTTNSMPQTFPIETVETTQDNLIRTDYETGPRKMRRRFTAVSKFIDPPASRWMLTGAQIADLETFYDVTCGGGALEFDWGSTGPIPIYDGSTSQKYRFDGRPKWTSIVPHASAASRLYAVEMRLEVLP